MNLSLAIASFLAAGIGLLVLILQLALLARFDALKKQILAAANANNGSQRPSRDNNQQRRQPNDRRGGRNEHRESQPRSKSQRVTGTVESSLRDINLRLKNAERNQEAARREVKETATGENLDEGDATRDSGQSQRQDRRQGRNSRGRRRRSSRNNRNNRQPQRNDESTERQSSPDEQAPQADRRATEEKVSASADNRTERTERPETPSHDDNQRVVVKRRMLSESEQTTEAEGHTESKTQHSESAESRTEAVAFGRQPAPTARKEPQQAPDESSSSPAPETASDERQEEKQRGETVFGRR
ncbi:MAG: hypothetical protein GF331_27045 [Chitinivibrionales bacterium]|nr:hypothetical protein [Chitinivibrionales bacterium]